MYYNGSIVAEVMADGSRKRLFDRRDIRVWVDKFAKGL
jgi:hypothetical protein